MLSIHIIDKYIINGLFPKYLIASKKYKKNNTTLIM